MKPPLRTSNRFRQHTKKIALVSTLLVLVLIELLCTLAICLKGHQEFQNAYPVNRVISGYSVYRHTPQYDFGVSTISDDPDEPSIRLDANGFICDEAVTKEKAADTVRIFLMGGSTAIGAGQTTTYAHAHTYPQGIFSYRLSIAGRLKEELSRRHPTRNFQVITAAAFERKLHQSLLIYLESISRFSPDIIITLDGMNDLPTLASGTPYADSEESLPEYIDLWVAHERKSLWQNSSTAYVLSKVLQRTGLADRHIKAPAGQSSAIDQSFDAYENYRDTLVRNSSRFIQIARHFQTAVKSDRAYFIFALQPLLHREGTNKELSPTEQKLDQLLSPGVSAEDPASVLLRLANRHFPDDYLCAELETTLTTANSSFIDTNLGLTTIDASTEVFTDYCHLTPEGNRIVAGLLADACDAIADQPVTQ